MRNVGVEPRRHPQTNKMAFCWSRLRDPERLAEQVWVLLRRPMLRLGRVELVQ